MPGWRSSLKLGLYQPASALTVSVTAKGVATRQSKAARTVLAALDCRAASGSQ